MMQQKTVNEKLKKTAEFVLEKQKNHMAALSIVPAATLSIVGNFLCFDFIFVSRMLHSGEPLYPGQGAAWIISLIGIITLNGLTISISRMRWWWLKSFVVQSHHWCI